MTMVLALILFQVYTTMLTNRHGTTMLAEPLGDVNNVN